MAIITLEDGSTIDVGLLTDTTLPTGQIGVSLFGDGARATIGSGGASTLGLPGANGAVSVSLLGLDLLAGVNVGGGGATGGSGGGSGSSGGSGAGSGAGSGSGGSGTAGSGSGAGFPSGPAASGPQPDVNTAYANIFRTGGAAPSAEIQAQLDTLDGMVKAGSISQAGANLQIVHAAAPFTGLAVVSYAFFTGKVVSLAGLDYLTNSSANPTDLNDAYYAPFNTENRYVNFASNLGLHGEGAGAFVAEFGPLTFEQAVDRAYLKIVGIDPSVNGGFNSATAVADIKSRQPFFERVAYERFGNDDHGLATKLAAIGYILQEAVRSGVGVYGDATENYLFDLADGQAQQNVDLVGVYGPSTTYNVDVA